MTPLNTMIDKLFVLRTKKNTINAQLTDIKEQIAEAENRLLNTLEALGTDTARTKLATVTATIKQRYNISDYVALTDWVLQSPEDRIYLFERRLGQAAVKEMLELGTEDIPGTTLFETPVISMRKR